MPKLPRIPSTLVIRALKRARFYEFHQSGSHIQLRHYDKLGLRACLESFFQSHFDDISSEKPKD